MSAPLSPFPDVEALVVQILQADPGLSAATVSVDPPAGFDGTQPVVLVSRMGGAWIGDLYLDQPMIELDTYGPDKAATLTLANAARHTLLAALGTVYGSNTITDVTEQDGPRWLPDYLYGAANRYVNILKVSLAVS